MPKFPMLAAAIIAQQSVTPIGSNEWWMPLVNTGATGAMLVFFMWQFSKKEDERIAAQRDWTKALNANTTAMMVVVAAFDSVNTGVRDMAKRIADETKSI